MNDAALEFNLKEWRQRLGWTQQRAAQGLGIALRTYSDRESKTRVSTECFFACMWLQHLHSKPTPVVAIGFDANERIAKALERIVVEEILPEDRDVIERCAMLVHNAGYDESARLIRKVLSGDAALPSMQDV